MTARSRADALRARLNADVEALEKALGRKSVSAMIKIRPFRTRYSQRYDAWEGLSDPRKLALSTPRGVFLQPFIR